MELREYAERILLATDLETKWTPIGESLTDIEPGPSQIHDLPGRPIDLPFAAPKTAPPMPHPQSFREERKRGVAHHIMANHELQALEVMADVLLRFPESPTEFRHGLAMIMRDEQRHTRMHAKRADRLGVPFGSLPVNGYIWSKARDYGSVLDYLAGLPLTFEGRNLDHTRELSAAFRAVDDTRSAALMEAIHRDEIEHVRFGLDWLRRMKPEGMSDWDAYTGHLHWPIRPSKARGAVFQEEARRAAGMETDFLEQLRDCPDE